MAKQQLYRYTNTLKEQLALLGREDYLKAHDMLDHYISEYTRMHKVSPVRAAHTFHVLIDKCMVSGTKDQAVSCRKGCSFCCSYYVCITRDEAELLWEYAKEQKLDINLDNLNYQGTLQEEYFTMAKLAQRQCVFLKNNECGVYEHRPAACRKYSVVSEAELCNTETHPGGKVLRSFSMMAEILTSAMYNACEQGGMSAMVNKVVDC